MFLFVYNFLDAVDNFYLIFIQTKLDMHTVCLMQPLVLDLG